MAFAKKSLLILFLAAHPAIIVFLWFQGNKELVHAGGFSELYALGRLAGLLLVYQVLLQLFFIGRVGFLDRLFGHDRLVYAHRWNGFLVLVFLFAHPLLLSYGAAGLRGVSAARQFLFFLTLEDVSSAVAAHLIFFAAILFTLYAILRKAKYEVWYAVHIMLYGAILLSFSHQLGVGEDLAGNLLFRAYWYALYAFFVGAFLFSRFMKPAASFFRHKFFLERVVPECRGVFSFYLKGERMESFKVSGGQFLMLRFLSPGFVWQSHPFSVSMPPRDGELRVTAKALGDFTRVMKDIPVRTKVLIDGPHGVFTAARAKRKKILCVAGGIGITPIRSVAEDALRAGKQVTLVFCAKTKDDFAFREEFAKLAEEFGERFSQHYLASEEEEGWLASLEQGRSGGGETGTLNEEKLYHLVPDFAERECYLCGPVSMMKMVRWVLRKAGVRGRYVHFERFRFL